MPVHQTLHSAATGLKRVDAHTTTSSSRLLPQLSKPEILGLVMSRLACSPRWEELDLDREKLMRWVNLSVNLYGLARNYELAGKVKGMDVLYALPLLSMCNDKEVWLRTHLMKWDRFVDGYIGHAAR